MMPHPTHETLGCRMKGRRLLRTQTDISIPTICLLMIHWKWSCGMLLSIDFPFFVGKWFSCIWSYWSLSRQSIFLFRASLIKEFHFIEILLFSDPRTFDALRGTISWNLNMKNRDRLVLSLSSLNYV